MGSLAETGIVDAGNGHGTGSDGDEGVGIGHGDVVDVITEIVRTGKDGEVEGCVAFDGDGLLHVARVHVGVGPVNHVAHACTLFRMLRVLGRGKELHETVVKFTNCADGDVVLVVAVDDEVLDILRNAGTLHQNLRLVDHRAQRCHAIGDAVNRVEVFVHERRDDENVGVFGD